MKRTYLNRHQKILECLEKLNENEYITGLELSKICNVSAKTIRHDIHDLNDHFIENAIIKSKQGKGYYFVIQSEQYKDEKEVYLREENEMLDNSIQRSYYIMRQLLLNDQPIRIEELSEQMFIDRTSVSRDMKYVRDFLLKFHLQIAYKVGHGNYIVGDEIHKRLCMEDIFTFHMISEFIKSPKDLRQQLSYILDCDGISMIDSSIDDMVKYILIMLMRIQKHHFVKMSSDEVELLKEEYEYQVAEDIAKYLITAYHSEINEEEICFLTVHLIGKRINYISDIESCLVDVLPDRVEKKMLSLFSYLYKIYGIDFSNDFYLKKALGVHILSMENRIRFDTYLKNPMLKMIKKNYLLAYLISVDIWLFLHPELNVVYSEDEIAYFTIHIQYSLMRNYFKHKKKVLLVNNLNSSSTELLSYALLQEFDEYMEITDSIHIRQLQEFDLDHYDLMISTSQLEQSIIPVIQIAPILDQSSMTKIRTFFTKVSHYSLGDFLKKENIVIHAGFDSKQVVLEYIAKQLSLPLKELLLKEEVGNMAMEGYIAVPQIVGYSHKIEEIVMTLDKPIVWDNEFVQCILFVSLPKQFFSSYQGFYSLLQKLIMDQRAIEKILSIDSQIAMKQFFNIYH